VGYNGKGTPGAGTSRLAIRKIMSLSLDNQVFPIEGKGEKQSKAVKEKKATPEK
jgi:hypothetical protein